MLPFAHVFCGSRSLSVAALGLLALPTLAQSPSQAPLATETAGAPASLREAASVRSWVDFDGNGILDLYVLTPGAEDRLLRNLGDGTFENVTENAHLSGNVASRRAVWEDFDEDGQLDLMLVTAASSLRLYRGNDSGVFDEVTDSAGRFPQSGVLDARWIDFDADGRSDLELLTPRGLTLFHNLGHGTLAEVRLDLPDPGASLVSPPRPVEDPPLAAEEPPENAGDDTAAGRGTKGAAPAGSGSGSRQPVAAGSPGGTPGPTLPRMPVASCATGVTDMATGTCVSASSIPMLGTLYPLGVEFNIDGAGQVGIGTTTPSATLDVVGGAEIDGSTFNVDSANDRVGVGTTSPAVKFTVDGGTDVDLHEGGYIMAGSTSSLNLAIDQNEITVRENGVGSLLYLNNDGGNVSVSGGDNTGKFGIGTNYPAERLHVAGDIRLDAGGDVTFTDDNTRIHESSDDLYFEADDDIYISPDDDVRVDGDTLFVDGAANRVGLGVTAPAERLHVAGDIRLDAGGDVTFTDDNTRIHETSDDLYLEADDDLFLSPDDDTIIDGGTLVVDGMANEVGIGTSDPLDKLHVAGVVRADGGVRFPDGNLQTMAAGTPAGVAQNYTTSGTTLTSSWQNIVSRTIDCPTDGYVLAIGSCEFVSMTNSVTGAYLSVSATSGSASSVQNQWTIDRVNDTDARTTLPIHHVMEVAAGDDRPFYLVATRGSSGATRTDNAALTLVFIPKAYGTITP